MTDLCFEEIFGAADPNLVNVDLALLGEDTESGIFLKFSGLKLSEDQQKFAKWNMTVAVFVDFLEKIDRT